MIEMDKKRIVNNFLIISCTGKNDKIGLKIDNNFFIHDIQTKIYNNDTLVDKILDLVNKNKANIDENFSVIVNNGPGKFSSIRAALAVAKGIQIYQAMLNFMVIKILIYLNLTLITLNF